MFWALFFGFRKVLWIKLVLPIPGRPSRPPFDLADFGLLDEPTPHPSHWYARWRALPEDQRNVLRTYTPAAIRSTSCEIDIDFVIHEPAGPAPEWALAAQPGDELVVTGPDVRMGWTGYGICWDPGDARDVLIIGDETAFPAIRNIVASLGPSVRALVLAEVGTPADDLVSAVARDGVTVSVVARGALEAAVRNSPTASHVWIAGESGSVTRIRRHLTEERGLSKDQVSFLGYWKPGGRQLLSPDHIQ